MASTQIERLQNSNFQIETSIQSANRLSLKSIRSEICKFLSCNLSRHLGSLEFSSLEHSPMNSLQGVRFALKYSYFK